MTHTYSTRSQQGFTLVEMAFVIMILGLLLGSFFGFLGTQQEQAKYKSTVDRQKKIAAALSSYAQTRGNLPCPAVHTEPFNTRGTAPTTCTGPDDRNGIVPFRTLGLTREDILDGYGNPFTYAVSAAAVAAPTTSQVHQNCRTLTWIPNVTPPTLLANLNPSKASFCCRIITAGQQIMIFSDRDNNHRAADLQNTTSNFAGVNDQYASATNPADRLTYFAYVLVSHGPDGIRSYIEPQSQTQSVNDYNKRKTVQDSASGKAEKENGDCTKGVGCSNEDFVAMPRSIASGQDHFDDIVLWRTQEGVMSEFNNDSCARP